MDSRCRNFGAEIQAALAGECDALSHRSLGAQWAKLRYMQACAFEGGGHLCCRSPSSLFLALPIFVSFLTFFHSSDPTRFVMARFSLLFSIVLSAVLVCGTACTPKASEEASPAEEAKTDVAASDADASDKGEGEQANEGDPVIQVNAPDSALLDGQGLRNPQEEPRGTDGSGAEDSGLKLQLGGGSGYGYQRNQPSLLNN